MRPLLRASPLALALVLGCGPSETGTPRTPCETQLDCDKELHRVCEAKLCGDPLSQAVPQDLFLSLSSGVQLRMQPGRGAFRAAVVYPRRTNGVNVRCKDISSIAQLRDDKSFNLAGPPIQVNLSSQGEVIRSAIFLDAPGRSVFVEVLDGRVNQGPEEEGNVIGVGCLDDAPHGEGANVVLTINPPPT